MRWAGSDDFEFMLWVVDKALMDQFGPPHWVLALLIGVTFGFVGLFLSIEAGLGVGAIFLVYFLLLLDYILICRRLCVGHYQEEWSP